MRIVLTGDKGFVGVHIRKELEVTHEVVGLEATEQFQDWYDNMNAVMDTDIDAVIHIGAISNNQCQDPDIYLWNSYATYLLAQRVRQKSVPPMDPDSSGQAVCKQARPGMDGPYRDRGKLAMPFIFFSSFLVGSTMDDWSMRTPYTWSKAQAEDFVRDCLPHATILRPCVMWGNEAKKVSTNGTVPYRLASHDLEYMFSNWVRKYVHVSDVVEAVKLCLYNRPQGTFDLAPDRSWTNQELAELVEWKNYQWIDNPQAVGLKHISTHVNRDELPTPPGWTPKVLMEEELPRLERELNGAKA